MYEGTKKVHMCIKLLQMRTDELNEAKSRQLAIKQTNSMLATLAISDNQCYKKLP